jgi:hypothetical protein
VADASPHARATLAKLRHSDHGVTALPPAVLTTGL